jgi:hypothetical protein
MAYQIEKKHFQSINGTKIQNQTTKVNTEEQPEAAFNDGRFIFHDAYFWVDAFIECPHSVLTLFFIFYFENDIFE